MLKTVSYQSLSYLFSSHCYPQIRFTQFWRTYDQHWRPILKFLPPSTHGTCDDCCDFKDLFRTTPATWSWNISYLFKFKYLHAKCSLNLKVEFCCSLPWGDEWNELQGNNWDSTCSIPSLRSAHKVSDAQRRFEVASLYRQHVEQVGQDRSLEDFVQAAAWISRACWSTTGKGSIHIPYHHVTINYLTAATRRRIHWSTPEMLWQLMLCPG